MWDFLSRKWRPCYVDTFVYTVPVDVAEDRIEFSASNYRNKAGTHMESKGWTVLELAGPFKDTRLVAQGTVPPDRKQYVIWGAFRRRPEDVTVEVPDRDVEAYLRAGYKLKD